jgi:hypothetical protein
VQLHQPLALLHIAFAPRQILRLPRVQGAGGVADEWVTQLLRQRDSQVFKKYSQMKLKMQRESLETLNRASNEMTMQTAVTVPETRGSATVLIQKVTNGWS